MRTRLLFVALLLSALSAGGSVADTAQGTIQSKVLQQTRRYHLQLPEGYKSHQAKMPVLYIIDSDFQFDHTVAVVQQLTRAGRLPPMIVVGIATDGPADYLHKTSWTTNDLAGSGGAPAMLNFINSELVPMINQQYRTSQRQALAGYSMGGLLTLQAMEQATPLFQAFYAMSPSLWLDDYKLVHRLAAIKQFPSRWLYLSVANEREMGVDRLVSALNQQKPAGLQLKSATFSMETHYSTAIPALYDALTSDFAGYQLELNELLKMPDRAAVINYFAKRQQHWAGFQLSSVQAYELAKYLWVSQQWRHASEFVQEFEQQLPGSAGLLASYIAKALLKKGEATAARQLLLAVKVPANFNWQWQLADCYQALGQSALAAAHLAEARRLARLQQVAEWELREITLSATAK